jgi:uroporphyrinogen-III decarboxylase
MEELTKTTMIIETKAAHEKYIQGLREKIERETGKTPEALYAEREGRVQAALALQEPDRVPMWMFTETATYCGVSRSVEYYDPIPWKRAATELTVELEPDLSLTGFGSCGSVWDALDVKNRLWPGGTLPPNYEYQFVEGEYMKEDEIDMFLSDPSDFVIRRYLPRIYGSLKPLDKLPPLNGFFVGFEGSLNLLTGTEFRKLARTLVQAARAQKSYRDTIGSIRDDLSRLGFPPHSQFGGVGGAPFDTVSSFFRGMKGSMLDMYRRPEKLLQLCDRVMSLRIEAAVPAEPDPSGFCKRVAMPLWRGDKTFMSDQQFKKFYWPGLKKALLATIDLGFMPMPIFEDTFGERLECLLELPRGKVVAVVDHTDAIQAKEILGGHTCVIATLPASIKYVSLREAAEIAKSQIKACMKGGGYMLNLAFPAQASIKDLKGLMADLKESAKY